MSHNLRVRARLALAAAAAIACAIAAPQSAAEDIGETAVTVRLGDLDLNSEEGGVAALARIGRAADQACNARQDPAIAFFTRLRAFNRCQSEAVFRSVEQLRSETVSRAYRARNATAH